MYDFLLQMFLLTSLAVVVFLMARALPGLSHDDSRISLSAHLDAWLDKLPIHKIDGSLNLYFYKTLKRVRLVVMRLDNSLASNIDRLRKNGENGNGKGGARELIESVNSDKIQES